MNIPTEEEVFFKAKAQIALSVRALEYLNGFQYLQPSRAGHPCPVVTEHGINRFVRCHPDDIYIQKGGRSFLSLDDFATARKQQEWRAKNPRAKEISIGFLVLAGVMLLGGMALTAHGLTAVAFIAGIGLAAGAGMWGLMKNSDNHEYDHITLFTLSEYVALTHTCESAIRVQGLLEHAVAEVLKIYAIEIPAYYEAIKEGMPA